MCHSNNAEKQLFGFLCCLVLLLRPAVAQVVVNTTPKEIEAGKYMIRHWSTRDGLPSDYLTTLFQTEDGYVWALSEVGLVRFDGLNFDVYDADAMAPVITAQIRRAVLDDRSTFWILSRNGELSTFRGRVFSRLEHFASREVKEIKLDGERAVVLANDSLWQVAANKEVSLSPFDLAEFDRVRVWRQASNGDQWLGSMNGLFHFDGQEVRRFSKESGLGEVEIKGLAYDADSLLWVSTAKGFGYLDKDFYRPLVIVDSDTMYRDMPIKHVYEEDNHWLLANDRLHLMNTGVPEVVDFGLNFIPWVKDIMIGPGGKIWAIAGHGIEDRLYFRDGLEWKLFDSGVALENVNDILSDREGNIWFTSTDGLFCVVNRKVDVYTQAEGLPEDDVFPLMEDSDGRIWIGTWGSGVVILEDEKMSTIEDAKILPGKYIRSLTLTQNGEVILGGVDKATRLSGGPDSEISLLGEYQVRGYVRSFFETTDQEIIIGGRPIYTFVDGKREVYYQFSDTLETDGHAYDIVEDGQGKLYIATYGGLLVQDAGEVYFSHLNDVLPTLELTHLYLDEAEDLWVGMYGMGVARIRRDSVFIYSEDHGLLSNTVNASVEDDHGYMWFSHNNGISRVEKQQLDKVRAGERSTFKSRNFNQYDGLPNSEISRANPSLIKARDGRIWFPTSKGVGVFDPDNIPENTVPPTTIIKRIEVNGEELIEKKTQFGAHETNVAFWFAGLSYAAPEKNQFQYYLRGWEESWRAPGFERDARYTNLPPGDYTFLVKASNNDGIWDETPASFSFTIARPFYATRLFQLLVAFLAIGLVLFWNYQTRLRTQLKAAKDRNRMADDLHDELGGIGAVALFMDALSKKDKLDKQDQTYLKRQAGVALQIAEELRDYIWAIDSEADQLEHLITRMVSYAKSVIPSTRLDISSPEGRFPYTLSMFKRRDTYLLFKEAVNNAMRHNDDVEIAINISLDEAAHQLLVSVSDKGKGFDMGQRSQGRGLRTMKRRAESLGGFLQVKSQKDVGTSIKYVVELM